MPAAAIGPRGLWSIPRMVALLVLASATAGRAAAEPMGNLRLDAALTVRGLTTLEPERLAKALVADDDLLLLSRPQANRRLFLSAVGRKATLALQHAGFEAAKATATVEGSAAGDRLVVDIAEGPRSMAAGVEISGLPDDLAGGLQRWIQGQRPPPGALAETVEGADGWGGTSWLDDNGRPVTMEEPLWTRGQPAAFDPPHLKQIRTAIGRFLRDQGRFSAAALVEERKPAGLLAGLSNLAAAARLHSTAAGTAVEVAVKPGSAGAVLSITITDLPPPAVLEDVRLPAGTRTTREALLAALGIVPGAPVTEPDRLAWKQRLRMSGRFLREEVTFEPSTDGTHGANGVIAVFDLEDYDPVAPLGTALSREEEVMLRFREWLVAILSGGEDIAATWERAPTPGALIEVGQPTGELVLSSNDGLLVSVLPGSDRACGAAITADGIGCFLPGQAGRFEVPLPSPGRLTAQLALSLVAGETATAGFKRQLTLGVGFESRPRATAAPFAITARIEPAACLALVHEGKATTRWEGETLIVTSTDLEARFEGPSGRLLLVQTPDGHRLSLRTAVGDVARSLAALRAAAGEDRAQSDALLTSGIDFFTAPGTAAAVDATFAASGLAPGRSSPRERFEHFADWLHGAGMSERGAAAEEVIAKVMAAETSFPDRFARVVDILRRIGAAGGLAAADTLIASVYAEGNGPEPLLIPHEQASGGDLLMKAGKAVATTAWRAVEGTCSRDSWPASLTRMAALGAARDPATLEELGTFTQSDQAGPIAYLTAAAGVPIPLMAASFARRGEEKLSTAAFHADCAAPLALLHGWGLDRSLTVILRTLTDADAQLLGEMAIGDPGFLLPLVHDLRAQPSEAAATASLPESLDRWWEATLGKVVATALHDKVSPRTAAAPADGAAPVR